MADVETIHVGIIVAPQGVRGEVRVKTDLEDPQLLRHATTAKIVSVKPHKPGLVIARIDGVADRNVAETLRGTELRIPRAVLPELEDGYYHSELIGLTVVDAEQKSLGKIVAVANFGASDLLEIKPLAGDTFFLPYCDDVVKSVDTETMLVRVALPEAL